MISIQDLLNKIKWDKREKPEEYTLFYYDRIKHSLEEIKYRDIKAIEAGFLVIAQYPEARYIPLHRIRRVERKGKVVWERT